MATLLVRNLDDDVVRRLKDRASANGRSAEAEHRAILEDALKPKMTGAELWERLRGEGPYLDDDHPFFEALEDTRAEARIPDFSK